MKARTAGDAGASRRDPDVPRRLAALPFHDGQIGTVTLRRRERDSADDLHLELKLQSGDYPDIVYVPAKLSFLDCTYLKLDWDLGFKQVSSDTISSIACFAESELRAYLESTVMKHEPNALDDYWEFVVYLTPPGGRLHVFAKAFSCESTSNLLQGS